MAKLVEAGYEVCDYGACTYDPTDDYPDIIVPLGGSAASTLFETTVGITKLRGQWRDLTVGAHSMKALATLHPAYLLRQPALKRLAWADLLAVRTALDALDSSS